MKKDIIFLFSAIMLSTSAMANSSLDVLDKISNSAEVRNLVGNSFLIHVK